MSFIPPKKKLEFFYPGQTVIDRFGNERLGAGEWVPVLVIGWAVTQSNEYAGDSILRTVDFLDVYVADDVASPSQVRLPDGGVWQVQGHALDYNHGPFWSPDALVIHCEKVEG